MRIDLFEMERMQSRYWHEVEYDLSESGVRPVSIAELLDEDPERQTILDTALGYPLSEGSALTRERIADWYPGAEVANVTVMNGGSEANHLTLWTLLEPGDRLAFMVPNYLQGAGLGRHYGQGTDTFGLTFHDDRWSLDLDGLERAVTERTKVVMVCDPNNPTGHVLTEAERSAVVDAADRVGAWLLADEIYRGAEVETDETSPTFWGRYDKVVVTSGLSKAFGMPGLRIGWAVAPTELIEEIWIRHDYTTLTPGMLSDVLCGIAMEPPTRERILARTRGIVRENLPRIEEWISAQRGLQYARPDAGAICYVGYEGPTPSRALIERVREECSVLLVPAEQFGIAGPGFRIGFGFDIEHTLKALDLVGGVLAELVG